MSEESELPWFARLINHVLTPGSALSPTVWMAFNVVMFALFFSWLMLVVAIPDNIHVWAFGFLGAGLAFSTNWCFREVFARGLDAEIETKDASPDNFKLHTKKEN
ncbi:V-type ATPase assembly factor Pkr1 [Trypanosoma melophagium]|uniref:V-type ATPase assembly factor Pkr1 n=1 Tax=Trypanosoma melophagium TaxID=715481 RepID=UPI00351A7712|nr:V-type ATPase assembly factor Pkr1 [Trypanosoma melophagium]